MKIIDRLYQEYKKINTSIKDGEINHLILDLPNKQNEIETWHLYQMKKASFVVSPEQEIYSFGWNECGELGVSDKGYIKTPTKVFITLDEGECITSIYSNFFTTFVWTSHEKVFSFGKNNEGQLGYCTEEESCHKPRQVVLDLGNDESILFIKTNYESSFILTSARILAFGYNQFGQLGINEKTKNIYEAKEVDLKLNNGESINSIYVGCCTTFLTTTHSRVFGFGSNYKGSLGIGSIERKDKFIFKPVEVFIDFKQDEFVDFIYMVYGISFIVTTCSRIFSSGNNVCGQAGIKSKEKIISKFTLVIEFGNRESVQFIHEFWDATFIVTNRKVYACGANSDNQLGIENDKRSIFEPTPVPIEFEKDEKAQEVFCEWYTTFVVTTKSRVFAFGCNEDGELGIGELEEEIKSPHLLSIKLNEDEQIFYIIASQSFCTLLKTNQRTLQYGRYRI